jgi:hypothetical protein
MSLELKLLIGLNRPINRFHPREKQRHCGQQLPLEQGNLFLPVGMIDPGPRDQEPFGGVGCEQPLHGPMAGLDQGDRIFRTETNSVDSRSDLTPSGSATGRLQDRSTSQGAILDVPSAALLVGRLEPAGCILQTAHPLGYRETQGRCAPLTMLMTP